jgi:hypothetical protein
LAHVIHLLQGFESLDPDKRLVERDRAEPAVKVEQPFERVDSQEAAHVQICGQSSGQSDDADHVLGGLHLRKYVEVSSCRRGDNIIL